MNKYEKALETLKSKDIKLCVYKDVDYEQQPTLFDFYHSEIFTLQELVNITNQTKPIYKDGYCYCPNCGEPVTRYDDIPLFMFDNCPNCGQKLDWSEEE